MFLTDDATTCHLDDRRPDSQGSGRRDVESAGQDRVKIAWSESNVRIRLIGANPHPAVEGLEPLPGRVNYMIGGSKVIGIPTSRPSGA